MKDEYVSKYWEVIRKRGYAVSLFESDCFTERAGKILPEDVIDYKFYDLTKKQQQELNGCVTKFLQKNVIELFDLMYDLTLIGRNES